MSEEARDGTSQMNTDRRPQINTNHTSQMSTLEWIFSKQGMRKALADYRAEAPLAAPVVYASWSLAVVGLAGMFLAGPLGLPAVFGISVALGVGGVLACSTAAMSHLAVSIGRDLGFFRKKPDGEKGGAGSGSPSPSADPLGFQSGFQTGPAAKAAFNAGSGDAPATSAPSAANVDAEKPAPTGRKQP